MSASLDRVARLLEVLRTTLGTSRGPTDWQWAPPTATRTLIALAALVDSALPRQLSDPIARLDQPTLLELRFLAGQAACCLPSTDDVPRAPVKYALDDVSLAPEQVPCGSTVVERLRTILVVNRSSPLVSTLSKELRPTLLAADARVLCALWLADQEHATRFDAYYVAAYLGQGTIGSE